MKKKYLFLLLLFISLTASSQNWNLFPMNRHLQYDAGQVFQDIRIDSQKVFVDSTIIYFNPRIYNNYCYDDSVINSMFYQYYLFLVPKIAVLYPNQTKFTCSIGSKTNQLFFKQNASAGNTWDIGKYMYFKCDSVTTKNVFGSIDSVKYFSIYMRPLSVPIKNIGFVLSKNSGLLRFSSIPKLAFGESSTSGSVLIGYKENGIKIGNLIPEFKDFFHLKQSDVLIWQYHKKDIDIRIPDINYYYKDSIIDAFYSNDTVKYKFIRTLNGFQSIDSVYYTKSQIEPFLKINPTKTIFSDTNPNSHNIDLEYKHWRVSDLTLTRTTCSISYDWNGYGHAKTTCVENIVTDVGEAFTINTYVGLSQYGSYGWGSITNEVVGSIIDGLHIGITSIPTSINVQKDIKFIIFPNPANKLINIVANVKLDSPYKIYNIQGKLVQYGLFQNPISIEHLTEGFYHISIDGEKSVSHSNFIKQ